MQPGYCDHVWVVEASRKYRVQRLRPDTTTLAPGENSFFADLDVDELESDSDAVSDASFSPSSTR